ncbi:hypothetical protein PR048_028550 [Dryococelus australis]|uniref:C-type lectin domain-containing protein n=1 Tax=Dryococelus australis TaxID=614101 RepID=A0ABQ9GAW7_9NEOP|nr:hypothetical protein PR048_028550 [Dryococelus australis]
MHRARVLSASKGVIPHQNSDSRHAGCFLQVVTVKWSCISEAWSAVREGSVETVEMSGRQYTFYATRADHKKARAICKSNGTYLAVVDSQEEALQIARVGRSTPGVEPTTFTFEINHFVTEPLWQYGRGNDYKASCGELFIYRELHHQQFTTSQLDNSTVAINFFLWWQQCTAVPLQEEAIQRYGKEKEAGRLPRQPQGRAAEHSKSMMFGVHSPGNLAILRKDILPALMWKIDIIEQAHPGANGLTHVVTIHTTQGTIKRSITKIVHPLRIVSSKLYTSSGHWRVGGHANKGRYQIFLNTRIPCYLDSAMQDVTMCRMREEELSTFRRLSKQMYGYSRYLGQLIIRRKYSNDLSPVPTSQTAAEADVSHPSVACQMGRNSYAPLSPSVHLHTYKEYMPLWVGGRNIGNTPVWEHIRQSIPITSSVRWTSRPGYPWNCVLINVVNREPVFAEESCAKTLGFVCEEGGVNNLDEGRLELTGASHPTRGRSSGRIKTRGGGREYVEKKLTPRQCPPNCPHDNPIQKYSRTLGSPLPHTSGTLTPIGTIGTRVSAVALPNIYCVSYRSCVVTHFDGHFLGRVPSRPTAACEISTTTTTNPAAMEATLGAICQSIHQAGYPIPCMLGTDGNGMSTGASKLLKFRGAECQSTTLGLIVKVPTKKRARDPGAYTYLSNLAWSSHEVASFVGICRCIPWCCESPDCEMCLQRKILSVLWDVLPEGDLRELRTPLLVVLVESFGAITAICSCSAVIVSVLWDVLPEGDRGQTHVQRYQFAGQEYTASSYRVTWDEAQELCQANGTNLATIHSAEEAAFLNTLHPSESHTLLFRIALVSFLGQSKFPYRSIQAVFLLIGTNKIYRKTVVEVHYHYEASVPHHKQELELPKKCKWMTVKIAVQNPDNGRICFKWGIVGPVEQPDFCRLGNYRQFRNFSVYQSHVLRREHTHGDATGWKGINLLVKRQTSIPQCRAIEEYHHPDSFEQGHGRSSVRRHSVPHKDIALIRQHHISQIPGVMVWDVIRFHDLWLGARKVLGEWSWQPTGNPFLHYTPSFVRGLASSRGDACLNLYRQTPDTSLVTERECNRTFGFLCEGNDLHLNLISGALNPYP